MFHMRQKEGNHFLLYTSYYYHYFFVEKENGTEMFALFLVISQNVCFSRSSGYFSIPTKVCHYCDGK